ncbi:hypothetical protein QFZ31_000947 [Neobacillus niacini]|nr:hypothetical protein [Neobacillus niacini]
MVQRLDEVVSFSQSTPSSLQQKEYTPKGFVDLDLEWFSADIVIVARAKENKAWHEGPVPAMFTALYAITIKSEEHWTHNPSSIVSNLAACNRASDIFFALTSLANEKRSAVTNSGWRIISL